MARLHILGLLVGAPAIVTAFNLHLAVLSMAMGLRLVDASPSILLPAIFTDAPLSSASNSPLVLPSISLLSLPGIGGSTLTVNVGTTITMENTITIAGSMQVVTVTATDVPGVATPVTVTDFLVVTNNAPMASGSAMATAPPAQTATSTALTLSTTNAAAPTLSSTNPVLTSTNAAPVLSATPRTSTALAAAINPGPTPAPMARVRKGKGPQAPPGAEIGGIPNKKLDIPLTVIFMLLFLGGAVTHFRIHGANAKKGHKFNLSTMMFDFCMVRINTCVLRIAWATHPNNQSLELAALIFEFAGVVVVFLVNIFFAQRIMRACHGNFGYHPILNGFFWFLIISVPVIIIHNIMVLTITFFTFNMKGLEILHGFQVFGSSYTLFLAFFPIPFIALATWIPGSRPVEKFGTGRFRNKLAILLYSSGTLTVGAVFRLLGSAIEEPADRPGWFDTKATFYITGFLAEIIVVYMYIFVRIDKRFHVPDGSSKSGDYAAGYPQHGWEGLLRNNSSELGLAGDSNGMSRGEKRGFSNTEPSSLGEVREAIQDIQLKGNLTGYPVDMGDDMLFYVFRRNSGVPSGVPGPGIPSFPGLPSGPSPQRPARPESSIPIGLSQQYGRQSEYGRQSKYPPTSPYRAGSPYDNESQYAPSQYAPSQYAPPSPRPIAPPPVPKSPRRQSGPSLPKTPVGWVGGHV